MRTLAAIIIVSVVAAAAAAAVARVGPAAPGDEIPARLASLLGSQAEVVLLRISAEDCLSCNPHETQIRTWQRAESGRSVVAVSSNWESDSAVVLRHLARARISAAGIHVPVIQLRMIFGGLGGPQYILIEDGRITRVSWE